MDRINELNISVDSIEYGQTREVDRENAIVNNCNMQSYISFIISWALFWANVNSLSFLFLNGHLSNMKKLI